jgi:hypothetical protein
MKKLFFILLVLVTSFCINSCDAPRINPLDPLNPDNKLGQLDGFVFSFPKEPLAKVKVIWKNQSVIAETDEVGYFKIENLQMKDGVLYFEKEGFSKDSVLIIWNNQKSKRVGDRVLNYTIVSFDGFVKTEALPRAALSGVKIFWKNQNILVATNSSGYYSFSNIPKVDGWLIFEKSGYSKDSIQVKFDNQPTKRNEDVLLNADPISTSLSLYTIVLNEYPNNQIYQLVIQTNVTDAEGDIDSVHVECNALKFKSILNYNPVSRFYENSFSSVSLKIISMDEAIGKDFNIVVKDKKGKKFLVHTTTIKRIIKQEVFPESPVNGQAVGNQPTLRWIRYLPGFNFKYMIQIYSDQISPILVWQKDNISKDDIEKVVDQSLPLGNYFWVIWCIDDFQNRARSKVVTFSVR